MIYNLYIFNRKVSWGCEAITVVRVGISTFLVWMVPDSISAVFQGKCLYYREWSRPVHTLSDDPEEDKRLMFGMLFSIKDLVSKVGFFSF